MLIPIEILHAENAGRVVCRVGADVAGEGALGLVVEGAVGEDEGAEGGCCGCGKGGEGGG